MLILYSSTEAQVQSLASACEICGGKSFSPSTAVSLCQCHSTNDLHSFNHLSLTLHNLINLQQLNKTLNKDLLWTQPVYNLIASLLLAVMVPRHSLATQDLRQFEKAPQVNTLTPCHHHLLLHHAAVTHTHCAVGHVLQQPANTAVTRLYHITEESDKSGIPCLWNDLIWISVYSIG